MCCGTQSLELPWIGLPWIEAPWIEEPWIGKHLGLLESALQHLGLTSPGVIKLNVIALITFEMNEFLFSLGQMSYFANLPRGCTSSSLEVLHCTPPADRVETHLCLLDLCQTH